MRHAALLALVALGGCTGSPAASACRGPGACAANDACPTLQICMDCACTTDPGAGACTTTATCTLGTSCRGGTCVRTACRSADDCQSGEDCELLHHACVASDCTTRPCPDGLTCDVARTPPACVACLSASDCGGATPVCGPDGVCAGCAVNQDCGSDRPVCSRSRVCGVCREDQDCSTGLRCSDAGTCDSCISDADCPGSKCSAGTCESGPPDGKPCGAGGACSPGLRCTTGPDPVCRPRCDPLEPASCGAIPGRVCALLRSNDEVVVEDGKPAAACLPRNGGGVESQPCGPTVPCELDLECLPTSALSGICRGPCDPSGAPCGSGLSCQSFPIASGGAELSLCTTPTTYLSPCVSDGDCDPQQACHPKVVDDQLVTRCDFGDGAGPGAACSSGSDCRSSVCLKLGDGGICFGGCKGDADCPDAFCAPIDVEIGTLSGSFSSCHPTCTSDAGCVGRGGSCGVAEHAGELLGECLPTVGAGLAGGACHADPDCRSGMCLLPAHLCAGACAHPGSDLGCAPDAVCRNALVSLSAGDPAMGLVCWGPSCLRPTDCGPSLTCTLEADPDSPLHGLRQTCLGPVGTARVGQPCNAGADCASGLCFGPFPGGHPPDLEDCENGADDDGDGLVDCQDPDCSGTATCGPGGEICKNNNVDDDRDGLADCNDPDCRRTAYCSEDCGNQKDDDGDGLVDCADPSCAYGDYCRITKGLELLGCFGLCQSDFDCAEGTVCQDVHVETPGGDSVAVRGCVPP